MRKLLLIGLLLTITTSAFAARWQSVQNFKSPELQAIKNQASGLNDIIGGGDFAFHNLNARFTSQITNENFERSIRHLYRVTYVTYYGSYGEMDDVSSKIVSHLTRAFPKEFVSDFQQIVQYYQDLHGDYKYTRQAYRLLYTIANIVNKSRNVRVIAIGGEGSYVSAGGFAIYDIRTKEISIVESVYGE